MGWLLNYPLTPSILYIDAYLELIDILLIRKAGHTFVEFEVCRQSAHSQVQYTNTGNLAAWKYCLGFWQKLIRLAFCPVCCCTVVKCFYFAMYRSNFVAKSEHSVYGASPASGLASSSSVCLSAMLGRKVFLYTHWLCHVNEVTAGDIKVLPSICLISIQEQQQQKFWCAGL